MNRNGAGKAAVVGILAVIAIAGFFIFRQAAPTRPASPGTDWVCLECDHTFIAPIQMDDRDCPVCPGRAVRTYIYYDTLNEELVEVYRERWEIPDYDAGYGGPARQYVKAPGGRWELFDEERTAHHGLPVIVERPGDLEYAPPGSEWR